MRRLLLMLTTAAAMVALSATTVFAASPHYVSDPSLTISNNALTVSGKAAGLGNSITTVPLTLAGTINVSSRCYTKKGNMPQAANKQESVDVNASKDFAVRHGQVTFSFSVSPLSTLKCPGNQYVGIDSVSYDLTLTWPDSLSELNATFSSQP